VAARNNADERRHSLSTLFSHQRTTTMQGKKGKKKRRGEEKQQKIWESFEFYQDTSIFDMSFLSRGYRKLPLLLLAVCLQFSRGKTKKKPRFKHIYTHTRLMSIFKGIRIKKKHKGIPTTMMMMMTATTRDTEARKRARCNRNGNHPLLQKAEAAAATKPRNQEKSSTKRNSKTVSKRHHIALQKIPSPNSFFSFSSQIFIYINKCVVFSRLVWINRWCGLFIHSCSVPIVAKL